MADTEITFLVEEAPEGGYTARALGQQIHTEADSLVELKGMVQDAVRCHFDERERPVMIRTTLRSLGTIRCALGRWPAFWTMLPAIWEKLGTP